ncbi:site-specific integrase [Ochrobactrum sp. AP1BH01-1]|uniref:site-specific integrase n=1 Tax=Ochrobactrum sp. AP1BH01-1 TaxID=2823874 RepID=UPI001B37AA46|nr:site-specific integrase [Ochrobactrum sp. AP1BH01-1]MBQ0707874.1 tyrosine-type recombinase/integrase [Ochrobactrum sp. AP1BH01-1]
MPKLTKRIIDTLEPSETGEQYLWDSELKGFGVRMMPSGVGSYIIKYRNSEGRQRKMVLGRVGTLTPDEARQLAREKMGEVFKGNDPSAERARLRQSITVGELCDLYLEDAKPRLKPNTYSVNEGQLRTHIKPLIGNRTVAGLTRADIIKLQADIVAGKTAKERQGRGGVTTGGKAAAARAITIFGTVLEFAKNGLVVTENVVRGVKKPKAGKKDRFLSNEEISRLGKAMREADDESEVALAAVRFLMLSGCRRMEVLALPEKWLDPEKGSIRFGDTKTGAQIRPIGKKAFDAISRIESKNGWVFPSERGEGHFVGLPRVLERLCAKAKIEDVSLHVMRHTFASVAAEMGYSELTIAGLLGHSVPGVTARYAHVADKALVSAADQVAAKIADLLDGKPATSGQD